MSAVTAATTRTPTKVVVWYKLPAINLALRLLRHLVLIALGASFLLPFWWMVGTSLKPPYALFRMPPLLFPWEDPQTWDVMVWSNYPNAFTFTNPPFSIFILNTILIAGSATVGALISNPLVAYGLSRIRWPGRDLLFGITIATIFVPFYVTMIPLFLVFRTLGWINTPLPLIVPVFFGSPFFIFLLRQFFLTIPQELSEAARIDGASEPRIFWSVMVPLIKPALATIALFEFLNAWRDFLGPLLYLQRKEQFTISLAMNFFRQERDTEWGLMMAMATVVTVPIIILFFFAQRTFIQGITLTGIKG